MPKLAHAYFCVLRVPCCLDTDLLVMDPLDEVGLGLGFASGLESPKPALPRPTESLALQHPVPGEWRWLPAVT